MNADNEEEKTEAEPFVMSAESLAMIQEVVDEKPDTSEPENAFAD
jgi:hypothetical protein